jgi:hypothetical protein
MMPHFFSRYAKSLTNDGVAAVFELPLLQILLLSPLLLTCFTNINWLQASQKRSAPDFWHDAGTHLDHPSQAFTAPQLTKRIWADNPSRKVAQRLGGVIFTLSTTKGLVVAALLQKLWGVAWDSKDCEIR